MNFRRSLIALTTTIGILGVIDPAIAAERNDLANMATDLRHTEQSIAMGDSSAIVKKQGLLTSMAHAIADASSTVWSQSDNRLALIPYLLGGGSPRYAGDVVFHQHFPTLQEKIIKGVLSYILGRRKQALQFLSGLDARNLDPRIAGEIAFTQAVLLSDSTATKSLHLLVIARMLAPGGLIEESSLRQQILIDAKRKKFDDFLGALRQYLIRFPNSLYAPLLLKSLPEIISRNRLVTDSSTVARLAHSLDGAATDLRNKILIQVARAALLQGDVAVAAAASDFLAGTTTLPPSEQQLTKLIHGFYLAMTQQNATGAKELASVNGQVLSSEDRLLLSIAREAAQDAVSVPSMTNISLKQSVKKPDIKVEETIQMAEGELTNVTSFLASARKQ